MTIRPVSDLRNKYSEVESELNEHGAIYLTKNGYGTAVLIDYDEYSKLTGNKGPLIIKNKDQKSGRGILGDYANPNLISMERNAGRFHAQKKFGHEVE